MKYEYEVDDHHGNKHSKKEIIDGDTARGEYRTLLPDGRNQVVTYESGPHGHLANVAYAGGTDASTYTSAPTYFPAPAPSYESAPFYAPAPLYAPASYESEVKPLHHTFSHIEYAKVSKHQLVRMLRLVRTLRILINQQPNLGIRLLSISSTVKRVNLLHQQLPRRTRLLLKLGLLPTRRFQHLGLHTPTKLFQYGSPF